MSVQPLAEVKANLSRYVDEVVTTHERVVITRNGRPAAVLMSVEDVEAMEETLAILATPGALEEIRQAEQDIAAGRHSDEDDVRALIERRRASGR